MGYYLPREMPTNRQRKTSKQINSNEYTTKKFYKLTTKRMDKISILAHVFNFSTKKAEAGISASELNAVPIYAISSRTVVSKY